MNDRDIFEYILILEVDRPWFIKQFGFEDIHEENN